MGSDGEFINQLQGVRTQIQASAKAKQEKPKGSLERNGSSVKNSSARKFKYLGGKCVNSDGLEGMNSFESVLVSTPAEKTVGLKFGSFGGTDLPYTYYELFDGECVDFTGKKPADLLRRMFPRAWIQTLNLKGAKGLIASQGGARMFNDFDSPRVMLEGAQIDGDIVIYSTLAVSFDKFTDKEFLKAKCFKFEEINSDWPKEIVKNNDLFCTTNSVELRQKNRK